MSNATTVALFDNFRAKLPGAGDDLISLELYNTVDEVAREALRTDPPEDTDADPADWLDTDFWVPCYQVLLHGTLYRMYTQLGKPWANADLGKVHFDLYTTYLDLTRTEFALPDSNSTYDRIVGAVLTLTPFAREDGIRLELFGVVNQVRLDAYNTDELDPEDDNTDNWLTDDQWSDSYQAVYHGTLGRMYSQTGKPWANPEAAKENTAKFLMELDQLRTRVNAEPVDVYERLIAAIRAPLPFVREEAVDLELFGVVNQLYLDVWQDDPLDPTLTDPTDWLSDDEYSFAYQAIYHGVLGRLYSQVGKTWANPDQAQAHTNKFLMELDKLRAAVAADDTGSAQDRLYKAISVQLPFVNSSAIYLELYNTVNKIRLEAYLTTPLGDSDEDDDWLDADQWDQSYQAIFHGTLARLYSQPSKPWADGAAYELHQKQFELELDLIRGTSHAEQDIALERLMNDLRIRLPGARDEVIKQELFAAADEFFKISGVWREEVPFAVTTSATVYDVESEESFAQVHRLLKVVNGDDIPVYATMKVPSEVTLRDEPSEAATWTATVLLTIGQHVDTDGYPVIPTWLFEQFRESFLDGVLGRMMSQIAKPYTNERMSTYHLRRFRNAIAQARTDAQRTFLVGAQNWQYPGGWR